MKPPIESIKIARDALAFKAEQWKDDKVQGMFKSVANRVLNDYIKHLKILDEWLEENK